MTDEKPPERLKDLGDRLRRARREGASTGPWKDDGKGPKSNPMGLAMRVGVELVSALAVGVGLGWLLDEWLGTRPWLMLVFMLLGGAAGILNVYRHAMGFGYGAGYKRNDDSDTNQGN